MVGDPGASRHQRVTGEDVILGERLRAIRTSKGITHRTLAAHIGVNPRQIHKYEHGINRISALRLNAIAVFLETPIEAFLVDFRAPTAVEPNHRAAEGAEMVEIFDHLPAGTRRALLTLMREILGRRKV